jgi:hypothetical protein
MIAMELTKEAIKRLNDSEIKVTLWNGSFNKAVAVAEFSTHRFELTVEKSHPSLDWMNGGKPKEAVELLYSKSSSGEFIDVPDSLQPLVEKMKQAATMTDDYALAQSKEGKEAFLEFFSELGLNKRKMSM